MNPLSQLPKSARIVEVSPRDGLQNEAAILSTEEKAELVGLLADAGLREIEVASFVRPDRVPQVADSAELLALLPERRGVTYSALVPNKRGLDRAIAAGVNSIALFSAASETFNQRNIGMTIHESLAVFREIIPEARAAGMRIRAYLSTAYYCPYEGRIGPVPAARIAGELISMGIDELSVGDTIGWATPGEVAFLHDLLITLAPFDQIAYHFHDTRGTALANVLAVLELGASTFDSSIGGAGGCPFAPGAAGNLATEDLVYMLDGIGIETGVDIDKLLVASAFLEKKLGKQLPGKMLRATQGALAR